jgi:HK97 family phage portal protein
MGIIRETVKSLFGLSELYARSLEDPRQGLTAEALLGDNDYETYTGTPVSATKALGYAPLYQAVGRISGDCAKLPLNVYAPTERGRSVAKSHPVQRRIHRYAKTNPEVSGYKFWRRFFTSALMFGNAYAWIDRNNIGQVIGLYQLLPDRTWMERVNGSLMCTVQTVAGQRSFRADDVLHVEGLSIDGVAGENTLKLFRQDFAIALAAKQFEARFFRNNMSAGGILQAKAGTDPKKVKRTEAAIKEKFSGSDNAFKTLVIRDAMQWINTQVDPQKAQLKELNEQQVREIARMYNLPPSYLGLPDSVSYNSEEAAKQNYYDGALSHWLIQNASECTTKLLSDDERDSGMYCEYNVNALLWADAITRNTIAVTGIQAGRWSANETRAWENADGYDGGDEYYRPLNVAPVGGPPAGDSAETPPADQPTADQPTDATRTAYRALLEDAFTRAINRITIRADRHKNLADDRQAVIGIIDSNLRNVAALAGREASGRADAWFDSLLGVDVASLRAHAEASSRTLIDEIVG